MAEIKVDEKVLTQAVKEAIATAVTATLTPEAFTTFVTAILNTKDYNQRTFIEREAIEAIKKHLSGVIEEWIAQNKDELKRNVFEAMDNQLAERLGERIVEHIAGAFYLERRR